MQAQQDSHLIPEAKLLELSAPSNIALIKYWGKIPGTQKPMNASLSFTLKFCQTLIKAQFKPRSDRQIKIQSFLFQGKTQNAFQKKIEDKINAMSWQFGVDLWLESENTFPHSSGIASSASSMSALAKTLAQIYGMSDYSSISSLAREFSGSAARSVQNGWSIWGKTASLESSSQDYAVNINTAVNPSYHQLRDWIFVCSKTEKKMSSTQGHALMDNHPYRLVRQAQAEKNMAQMYTMLSQNPQPGFFELIEQEALTLHALMMTSQPSFFLFNDKTVRLMQLTRALRNSGVACGFTLDAGSTLHFLFFKADEEIMQQKLAQGYFGHIGNDFEQLIQDECAL